MQNTPHSWADHTLDSFPLVLQEFFQQNAVLKENKPQLKVQLFVDRLDAY